MKNKTHNIIEWLYPLFIRIKTNSTIIFYASVTPMHLMHLCHATHSVGTFEKLILAFHNLHETWMHFFILLSFIHLNSGSEFEFDTPEWKTSRGNQSATAWPANNAQNAKFSGLDPNFPTRKLKIKFLPEDVY